MDDLISRQMLLEYIHGEPVGRLLCDKYNLDGLIKQFPSAQPEIKPIEYRDCADAMLKMWIDNVVTDGEYNRIMDKLNAHWGKNNG